MGRWIENWYPWLLGVATAVAYFAVFGNRTLPKTTGNLLQAIVGVAGIAVGFLAAAQSILLSIDDSRIIRQLRNVGRYDSVMDKLDSAMMAAFVLAVISGVGLFVDFETTTWPGIVVSAWVGLLVATIAACFRVIRIFKKILRSPR